MVAEVSKNDAFRGGGVIWVRSCEKNPGVQLVYMNMDEGVGGAVRLGAETLGKT